MDFFNIIQCDDWLYFNTYILNNYKSYNIIRCETLDYAAYRFRRKSFLNVSSNVYVIDNDEDLNNNIDNLDALISGNYQNGNIIIYKLNNLDKRSKLYKRYNKIIKNVIPNLNELVNDINIDNSKYKSLCYRCNNSFSRVYYELEKVKSLSIARDISINESLDLILNNLFNNNDVDTFAFISCLIKKDLDKVKNYLLNIDTNNFDFGLFTLLYNQYHNIYVVKSSNGKANVQNSGLSQFTLNECYKYSDIYSIEELKNILKFLIDLDYKIKSGGLDSTYAYDLLLTRLLS